VVSNKRRSRQKKKKKKKKKEKKRLTQNKQKGKEAKQLFEGEILSDISSFTHTTTYIHHHVVTTARERGESGLTVHAREIVPVIFE
jgi:DNA invertase Pin-like site-specific DNA recombinase